MFGTIDIRTRPLKLAYLVDPKSSKQVSEAISLSSTLWGGSYFPIIPVYKRMPATWRTEPLKAPLAKDVITGYLEAFDPDFLVQFSRDLPDFISAPRIIKPTEIWDAGASEGDLRPNFGVGIFEILNGIFDEYFKYKAKYPVEVMIPTLPKELSLFWASWLGKIPETLRPLIDRYFSEPLEIKTPEVTGQLSNLFAKNALTPRRVTHYGLEPARRSGHRGNASVFLLDASETEDVVDFWNLRASGRSVLPVPKQLQEDPQLMDLVIEFLRQHRVPWGHNKEVFDFASIIKSRSCTLEEMQAYADSLRPELKIGGSSKDPFFSLQQWYPRIWDEWARGKDAADPVDYYGEEVSIDISQTSAPEIHFKPVVPTFAKRESYQSHPWCANEVGVRVYGADDYVAEVFPKASGKQFRRVISGVLAFRDEWRVGRNGLVKLISDDRSTRRELPAAEDVVFSWLTDLGWKPNYSPPGRLAKLIQRTLDGNTIVLRNPDLLGFLEYMNGGSVSRDGKPSGDKVMQERDLPVGEVITRLGGAAGSEWYKYLISKNVFKLGLRIECPRCLRHSWFPVGGIGETIDCPRCRNSFSAIGNLEKSLWSYKTAGPFNVPRYADGSYAVLLTIEFFSLTRMSTLRTTPVLSFSATSPGKKEIEADFALFWQDSLYGDLTSGLMFGECKSYGRFVQKDFERMGYLAKAFPGSVLVFSTLRDSLSPEEVKGIRRIALAGRKYWKADQPRNPVLILTGTELFGAYGPPMCWQSPTKERFQNLHGLLGLCDATHQIYLKLPSWHVEWQETWERRREKLRVKKRQR
jgi:hypothetical protein